MHVDDGVAWCPTDERVVGKQRVFGRVEVDRDATVILHTVYTALYDTYIGKGQIPSRYPAR